MGIATDFILILLAGLLGGILARLLRLPTLVGYVVGGIFVGPHTAGPTVVQIHDIELLAEIGVALLLFSLGLEISFRDLRPVRTIALIGGPLQIVGVIVLGALAVSYGLGIPSVEAIWFGAMVSVSSTMVVVKVLSAAGVTTTLASRVMIGLLVVQDLAVIPMLIILPQLGNATNALPRILQLSGIAAVSIATIYFAGTRLLPRVLKGVVSWGSRELFLVTTVTIAVGIGYAAHLAGLSFALGAFIAGITLSESEFSHQALSDVVPLRDVFGLLFFVTVGMLFDPAFLLAHPMQILIAVTAIFTGKALIIGLVTRLFGYTNMAPWIIGLGLSQIGEFSFVLARSGFSSGMLSKPTYDLALSSTILTMALAPLVSGLALPLGRRWQARFKPASPPAAEPTALEPMSGHVVVAGYGRVGRVIARVLSEAHMPFAVVELHHALLTDVMTDGFFGIWGDIAGEEIQRAAHVQSAHMLLLTMPDTHTTQIALQRALQLNPKLRVIARATRPHHVAELDRMGAAAAVQPEFEGGVEMVRQALVLSHFDAVSTRSILDRVRRELYEVHDWK